MILYTRPFSSYLSIFSRFGFLGSKFPKPPAIATTLPLILVFLSVVIINSPSLFLIQPQIHPLYNLDQMVLFDLITYE